mgnify:CR=1 FL=1
MSALKPDVDGTHDLGTTALRWRQLHVDTFTTARKDSKEWNEAADFLEEHFDEKNIVTIDS